MALLRFHERRTREREREGEMRKRESTEETYTISAVGLVVDDLTKGKTVIYFFFLSFSTYIHLPFFPPRNTS